MRKMKIIKRLIVCFLSLTAMQSCVEEEVVSYVFENVSAPTNVQAVFDVTNDDSGEVSVTPTAEGVTSFEVFFGDVENEEPTKLTPGEKATHVYAAGEYTLKIIAIAASGATSELIRIVKMSFTPPSDLVPGISVINNYDLSVTPTATNATVFDVYFGDVENEEPTTIMAGETANHTYAEVGTYIVKVVARGASLTTITVEESVNIVAPITNTTADFVGTWKLAAEAGSFGVGPAIGDTSWFALDAQGIIDRACFVDDLYVFGQDGSYANVQGSETWIEGWQGGADACGAPVAPHDGSAVATFSYDDTAGTLTITGVGAYLALSKGTNNGELSSPADAPESITYMVSLSEDKNTMNATIETSEGVFWQFKLVKSEAPVVSPIAGSWKLAAEAGSFGVGPSIGDTSWFALDAQGIIDRACLIDDVFTFGEDGSFTTDLGNATWIEAWQGGSDSCGLPVAPHDGTVAATYVYDAAAGTVTINGTGAYIALAKGTNSGELTDPANAPSSITYNVSLADNGNTMNVTIETDPGVFWQFKLVKAEVSPLVGTWKLAAEAGSFGVGPSVGDTSWFALDAAGITARACLVDDTYQFGPGGTFVIDQGGNTWIEAWQGGSDACGAPVAPHDGSAPASYVYDASAGTLTVNGVGAYIALAKGTNTGELASPADAPSAITYTASFSDNDTTMNLYIEAGAGVFWQFKLVKE